MDIKKYSMGEEWGEACMVEDESGSYVREEDYESLRAQLASAQAEKAELTEPMKKVLRYAMAQVQDFEEAECLLHGFRRSTVDKAFTWLYKAISKDNQEVKK
jgi:hypothetical protein